MEPGSGDDPSLPDSALDTGSDAGEPGQRFHPGDLPPDEERLLAALERDSLRRDGADREDADDEPVARAAADATPRPERGGPPDDGLTPRFSDSD